MQTPTAEPVVEGDVEMVKDVPVVQVCVCVCARAFMSVCAHLRACCVAVNSEACECERPREQEKNS